VRALSEITGSTSGGSEGGVRSECNDSSSRFFLFPSPGVGYSGCLQTRVFLVL
jgi:hypothetical protein